MANVKITQLPLATTPLTGTEDIPLVQGTTTKQVTVTGLFTSPVMTNPTLGTVGQADLINATGLPISTGVAGLGTGVATFLGTPSSTNLRAAVTDETGTGSLVFATSPTLVTPNLGTPSVLVATNATGTAVGLTAGSAITNANLTGAVTSVGNATSLGSFTSAQLRTALTDETGAGSAVFATSPTITAPILNQINDTNNAQILGLSPTTSAVDYLVVKNGIGVGVPLHIYADGSSTNVGLHIQPKGSGLVTISDGTDFNKGIRFRSSGSAASAVTLLDAVSTAGRVVTLPDATTTLVGRDTTDTLTNKTIAFGSNTFSGTLAIANGGTNASTAASAIENLLPAYTGNGSKGLRLNSGATALEWVADGGGTVTSVGGTGTVNGITLTGTVTTSGNLTLGGTLSGISLTSQVTGVLPTANGGTGLGGATPFTSGGVVYASSSSALATGSALTFDGSTLVSKGATNGNIVSVGGSGSSHTGYSQFQGYTGNGDASNINYALVGNKTGSSYLGIPNGGVGLDVVYGSSFSFALQESEILRLTSSSLYTASGINVGIGTSNIGAGNRLNVVGNNVTFSPNTDGKETFVFTTGAADKGILYIKNNTTNTVKLDTNGDSYLNGGNVGIGTSSPTYNLDVNKTLSNLTSAVAGRIGLKNGSYFASMYAYQEYYADTIGIGFTTTNAGTQSEKMYLSASGNLGLGVTPSAWSGGYKAFEVNAGSVSATTGAGNLIVSNNSYYNGTNWIYKATGVASDYAQTGGQHWFRTAASGTAGNAITFTQAMTLTSDARLFVGTTSESGSNDSRAVFKSDDASAVYRCLALETTVTTSRTVQTFRNGNGQVGDIATNGTATAYNTSSDYRLKNITGSITTSGAYIDSLNPVEGTWKTDGSTFVGLIAHEVQEASRTQVVTGTKDGQQMQSMDYSNSELIANLIAEVKSLRQRVATLEAQ